jgi:uncharacterized protein YjiS (DUF1127 family)
MNSLNLTAHLPLSTTKRSGAHDWLAQARATVRCWLARSHGRDELAEMDEHLLKDIGLSRSDALVETGKYFWQR